MSEIEARMLPPKEPDVMPDPSPVISEDAKPKEEPEPPKAPPAPAPGSQTPPDRLYAALEEERTARKALAQELEKLKNTLPAPQTPEVYSDEGLALKQKIDLLEGQLRSMSEQSQTEKLHAQYPVLKDKNDEFEAFKSEYVGVPLEKVARLFLSEQGLLNPTGRKGLESPNGGPKAAPTTGISQEDAKRLRENSPRKYLKALAEGKIKPEDIK